MKKPNIPIDSRILSISHLDQDGVVCQIILGQVFKNIKYLNVSFYKIDQVLNGVDFSQYDYVFVTDLHPEDKNVLNISDKIILIDHHQSAIEMHDPDNFHYVVTKCCASVSVMRFIERLYNVKLDHLDQLVHLTNDYDLYTLNNGKSRLFYDLMFNYYKAHKFRSEFFNGRTRFSSKELAWLKMRRDEFNNIYNNLDVMEFDKVSGCIVEASDFMNEIADKLMKEEDYSFVIIRNSNTQRVSIRHSIEGFDAGSYLKEKEWGGGHPNAAGFFTENVDDFENKVKILEKYIYKNFTVGN